MANKLPGAILSYPKLNPEISFSSDLLRRGDRGGQGGQEDRRARGRLLHHRGRRDAARRGDAEGGRHQG